MKLKKTKHVMSLAHSQLLSALKPQRFVAKSPSFVTAYLKKHWLHHMCVMEPIENTNQTLLYNIELFRKQIFTVLFPVWFLFLLFFSLLHITRLVQPVVIHDVHLHRGWSCWTLSTYCHHHSSNEAQVRYQQTKVRGALSINTDKYGGNTDGSAHSVITLTHWCLAGSMLPSQAPYMPIKCHSLSV